MSEGSRESLLRDRVTEVLNALAVQWPDLAVNIDIWRYVVVSQTDDYSDQQTEVWVRIAEDVPAFFLSTVERWYQREEGVIRINANWVIIPELYSVEPSDHIILDGDAWMVIEGTEQGGVSKLRVDKVKSRFAFPARTDPVYRQMAIRAHIA